MKKLLIVALMLAVLPAFAVEFGGKIDLNYHMETPNDDTIEPESYFGMVSTKITLKEELGEGLTGFVKLDLDENKSNGVGSASLIWTEEVWVAKAGAFGQEALGFKFGKMEVPGNLDYDTGTTHTISNRIELDETWGLNVNYGLGEGMGTINLTVFEGGGGLNAATGEDADTGMFQSLVLQWDTGKGIDAFGVAGLRLVVAYGMVALDTVDETASIISIAGTYTLKDLGLCIGLEIDMLTYVFNGEDGSMLIALNADYDINEEIAVGLSYEMLQYAEAGATDAHTESRIAIRASYKVADATKLRLEYAMVDDSEDDTVGESLISLGCVTKF
jgi:hypothetical protein